jgi:hypothetical protein
VLGRDEPGKLNGLHTRSASTRNSFGALKAAGEDQFVSRHRHPIDVLEHLVDADPGTVLRIFQTCRNSAAALQLRERGFIV